MLYAMLSKGRGLRSLPPMRDLLPPLLTTKVVFHRHSSLQHRIKKKGANPARELVKESWWKVELIDCGLCCQASAISRELLLWDGADWRARPIASWKWAVDLESEGYTNLALCRSRREFWKYSLTISSLPMEFRATWIQKKPEFTTHSGRREGINNQSLWLARLAELATRSGIPEVEVRGVWYWKMKTAAVFFLFGLVCASAYTLPDEGNYLTRWQSWYDKARWHMSLRNMGVLPGLGISTSRSLQSSWGALSFTG